jgi:hypothetical protein
MPGGFSRLVHGARRHLGDNLQPEDGYLSCESPKATIW